MELINAITHPSGCQLEYLHITEEVSYYQSKVFSEFIRDITEKLLSCKNKCQRDLYMMIMNTFGQKLSQKYFSLQSIIHINDLKLLKQQFIKGDSNIVKFHELSYPYFYLEYNPPGSTELCQIGSLTRINSFINACHRVKTLQSLSDVQFANIVYLDSQYALIKNQKIASIECQMNIRDIGKWKLKHDTSLEQPYPGYEHCKEIKRHIEHFKSKY